MKPGDVLRGKYQLVASIGRGGMGEVFRAVHLTTGANVAIKVVSRALLTDVLMARLEREAVAATRIQSDLVPRVVEIDRTEEGALFLVMELLHGETLAERRRRAPGGTLPWSEVRLVGEHVLQALVAAHAAGVVHRDLKPANIFLELLPAELGSDHMVPVRARVLDFGVCKIDGPVTGEKLTATGEAVGTIAYMAPEQVRGASKVDARADLYSFAMVVYELVCGRFAHGATGQVALLASKMEKPARSLARHVQVPVPAGLGPLVDRGLERDPAARFADAASMLAAWRALGPAVDAPGANPAADQPTLDAPRTAVTIERPPPVASRGALLVAGSVLAGCLLVALVALRHRLGGSTDVAPPVHDESADAAPSASVPSADQAPTTVPAAP